MALKFFILKVHFSLSDCSAPSPRCQTSRLWGFIGEFWSPRGPTVPFHVCFVESRSVFPFLSLTWQPETLMSHLAERRKGRIASEMMAKKALRSCQAPEAWPGLFLYIPWNKKWIFLASLRLPHLTLLPAPGSTSTHIKG